MKKVLSVLLTAAIIFTVIVPTLAIDVPTQKEEVVYGILEADGSIKNLYVVNSFQGGLITDYGDYSDISNMTSSGELLHNGDRISINTTADQFYYQGTLRSKALPWNLFICYFLDGREIPASELAGKNGELEIKIDITKNKAINSAFYDNYMLQVSLALDTEKCSAIESLNATIANAGKNKVITHTVLPGNDKKISITTSVHDFEMNGIEMTALPFSMRIEMPDTDSLTTDLTSLTDAVSELNDGVKDLSEGVNKTYSGAQKLTNGSSDIVKGLSELNSNSKPILNASSKIKSALADILKAIDQGMGSFSLDDLAALPSGLRQVSAGLTQIAEGMTTLKKGYAAAYSALDSAIVSIPDADIDPTGLFAAVSGDEALTATLNQLMGYYQAGKTVKGTYIAVKEAFASVEASLETMIGSVGLATGALTEMANEIEQSLSKMDIAAQMQQLKEGLSRLLKSYGQFHSGLDDYMKGVNDLTSGYNEVNSGIRSLTNGIGELKTGASDLYEGTSELNDAVADLPDEVQAEIDDMIKNFDKSDYVPISFVSAKNTDVKAVQFVMKTSPIKISESEKPEVDDSTKLNLWQKILKLFGLFP